MSAILQAEDLAFVSAVAREIEDVSFTLQPGRALAVVGGSGSGKSLLIRLLCGLAAPSEGHIRIDGEDVRHAGQGAWRRLRRGMGIVLEGAGLIGHLTMTENIVYPLLAAGKPRAEIDSDLEFALAYFDLYAWRHAMPRDLPAGVAKRALLARAAITDPPLLLCDNLFDGLYGQARSDVSQVLRRAVEARKVALLFTTSSAADAALMQADILTLG